MKYWRSGILCGLIACLGCGTFSYNRTNRPSFVSPPLGRPVAPPVPDTYGPDDSTIQPKVPQNGPLLNPSSRKTNSTRISTYQVESETAGFTPPPPKGYIELPPPPRVK